MFFLWYILYVTIQTRSASVQESRHIVISYCQSWKLLFTPFILHFHLCCVFSCLLFTCPPSFAANLAQLTPSPVREKQTKGLCYLADCDRHRQSIGEMDPSRSTANTIRFIRRNQLSQGLMFRFIPWLTWLLESGLGSIVFSGSSVPSDQHHRLAVTDRVVSTTTTTTRLKSWNHIVVWLLCINK